MTPKQKDALERAAAAGSEARAYLDLAKADCPACGHGTSIFKQREQQIVQEACAWFRTPSSTKDDHVAVRYIAALSEIRDLEAALAYRSRKADDAKATLFQPRSPESSG